MNRLYILLSLLALALLGGIAIAFAQGVATRNATPAQRIAASGKPFHASFSDVARKAGLTQRFVLGPEDRKDYIIEANGSGIAFLDYDNDGWLDIYLVNGSRLENVPDPQPLSRLYRNRRDGTFEDVTQKSGTGRHGWGNGVCAGDIDNDGFVDLYVTYWGPNALYRNRGDGTFQDVAVELGASGPQREWSTGCTFLDYDRDGLLDLFVTSYQQFDPAESPTRGSGANCEWRGLSVFCGPRGLPFGGVSLFRNTGAKGFEDLSDASGVRKSPSVYAFTAVTTDLNGDGWTDLYVASDSTPSLFLRNNKDGTFREIGLETALALNEHGYEQGGMGVAVGDADGDGRLDIVKTNFTGDYPNLYRNQGGGIFEDIVVRAGLAVNPQYVGWGVGLEDLDNDGWKDVFQVNGHVYPEVDKLGLAEAYKNPRLVYRNLGGGRFEDVSTSAGPGILARHSSRGAAFGDIDNDGDIDVLIMNMGEPPSLLRNDSTSGHNWISITLEGVQSNRSAIGAIVSLTAGARTQTAALLSQSSFLSQNAQRLHFGLGADAGPVSVQVRWPSGKTEDFPVENSNRVVHLKEGTGKQP